MIKSWVLELKKFKKSPPKRGKGCAESSKFSFTQDHPQIPREGQM